MEREAKGVRKGRGGGKKKTGCGGGVRERRGRKRVRKGGRRDEC